MKKLEIGLLALLLFVGGYTVLNKKEFVYADEIKNEKLKTDEMITHFMDTGNSDCIFIQTQTKNVLIDAGDNNDEEMIVDYLKNLKVKTIDYLVSTHPDADHAGGLDAVVKNFEIKETWVSNGSSDTKTYQNFIQALSNKGLKPAVPLPNKQFNLGKETYLQFFNSTAKGSGNEVSLMTLVVHKKNKFLLMGDAESKQERAVLKDLPDVDVIKVGHHGSKTSTSEELLKQTKPEEAVILCGNDNIYGHPHQETLKSLDQAKVHVYRSDINGTIVMTSNGVKIETSTQKQAISIEVPNLVNENYIGNIKTKKYHRLECKTLPDKKNQVTLESKEEAMKLHYNPCGNCKP